MWYHIGGLWDIDNSPCLHSGTHVPINPPHMYMNTPVSTGSCVAPISNQTLFPQLIIALRGPLSTGGWWLNTERKRDKKQRTSASWERRNVSETLKRKQAERFFCAVTKVCLMAFGITTNIWNNLESRPWQPWDRGNKTVKRYTKQEFKGPQCIWKEK